MCWLQRRYQSKNSDLLSAEGSGENLDATIADCILQFAKRENEEGIYLGRCTPSLKQTRSLPSIEIHNVRAPTSPEFETVADKPVCYKPWGWKVAYARSQASC